MPKHRTLASTPEMLQNVTPKGWHAGLTRYLEAKADEPAMATFRVQVNFGTGRTPTGPNKGVITLWASGRKLHGGGDEMVYLCKEVDYGSSEYVDFRVGKSTGGGGCGAYILPDFIRGGVAVCPRCNKLITAERLTGQIYFRLTTRDLATAVSGYVRLLDFDADVVVKYADDDIRYQMLIQEKGIAEARRLRGMLIYKLDRIIQDVSGGADMENRFFALLSA
jgi:hypothetical protein